MPPGAEMMGPQTMAFMQNCLVHSTILLQKNRQTCQPLRLAIEVGYKDYVRDDGYKGGTLIPLLITTAS